MINNDYEEKLTIDFYCCIVQSKCFTVYLFAVFVTIDTSPNFNKRMIFFMQPSNITQHHAHLWIGDPNKLQTNIIAQLQHTLCSNHGCLTCATCKQIANLQHPWINWLKPDGSYTLDQIDEILATVRFKLNPNEQRFFIFTQADELTVNCNNRLLKTVEEPHAGYFFIFLANRTDNILPTLISRCFVKNFDQRTSQHDYDQIIQPFLQASFNQPAEFMKMIDAHEIKERETKDVIDLLIQLFHDQLRFKQKENDMQSMLAITDKIIVLKQALNQMPPQGSAKLFWKNLYLTFHQQQ